MNLWWYFIFKPYNKALLSAWHKPRHTWKETISIEGLFPSDWTADVSTEAIFITNWCWKAHPTVGGATPGKMVLGCIRMAYEQAWRIKIVSGIHPLLSALVPAPRFLAWFQINTFLKFLFVNVLTITPTENKLEYYMRF